LSASAICAHDRYLEYAIVNLLFEFLLRVIFQTLGLS